MQVLFDKETIARRVHQLARDIMVDYYKKDLMILSVLNGAFIFTSDLVRELHKSTLTVTFIRASSYRGTLSTGQVQIDHLPLQEITKRNVLIVEDIVDTGRTCVTLRDKLMVAMPESLHFCTLLNKQSRREVKFEPRYTGFYIPDKFVIGYGLDFDGKYRNLAEIYTFEEGKNGSRR